MALAKDQLRQIIADNNITNVADVYSLRKDSFKDILQELMEAEMDATLGYEKNQNGNSEVDNKRNSILPKQYKVNTVSSLLKFLGIEMVSLSLN